MVQQMECPSGHERSPENTYIDPQGKKRCRTCRREAQRVWRDEHRDQLNVSRRAYHHRNKTRLNRDRKLRKAPTGR